MFCRIAIVGRPNVGKSSLFNRLVGRRVSIVDPTPGTTRDRLSAVVEIQPEEGEPGDGAGEPCLVELTDTGGYGVYTAEGKRFDDAGKDLSTLTPDIERQILEGARGADAILFVMDAHDGALPLDERITEILRREGLTPRVVAVANKADDTSREMEAADLARLGFGMPLCVSAKSGRGMRRLRERMRTIAADAGASRDRPADPEMKVAIVGRRNAGKSSLVNALAGQPRVIVSEIAGTTRDSVDVRIQVADRSLLLIDTAGVRKRKSWDGDLEYYANQRTADSIRRADVCILLLDALEEISQVEKSLASDLTTSYKPTVIAVNKWDLVRKVRKPADYLDYLEQELPGLSFAPIVFVSASTRAGLKDLMAMCFNLYAQAGHRETTGRVNAAIAEIMKDRGPSSSLGTRAKVFYVSQVDVRPPTVALVVNKPDLFEGRYEKYLLNSLRKHLPFSEVPIKLLFSARRRTERGQEGAESAPKVRRRAGKSRAASEGAAAPASPAGRVRGGSRAPKRGTGRPAPRTKGRAAPRSAGRKAPRGKRRS